MPDPNRGTDRAGRRAKRFLTPLQKYEIWLQLVRQEMTIAEAAERWEVDRATIARIRVVAKDVTEATDGNLGDKLNTTQLKFTVYKCTDTATTYPVTSCTSRVTATRPDAGAAS